MLARWKFHDARASDPARSHLMLAWVAGLYEVEDDARKARKKHTDRDDATWHAYRHDLRSRRSRPILEAIHTYLETERPKVLPKSPIGEAIWLCVESLARPDPALGGGVPGDR
jgi:transposase